MKPLQHVLWPAPPGPFTLDERIDVASLLRMIVDRLSGLSGAVCNSRLAAGLIEAVSAGWGAWNWADGMGPQAHFRG